MKKNPKYNVVSIRIDDQEREDLRRITRQTRMSVSQILRQAMQLYHQNAGTWHDSGHDHLPT